tara:strand:- start:43 stop:1062 length:1020 start_codon:yes stop_codon:yes gene_type:complete
MKARAIAALVAVAVFFGAVGAQRQIHQAQEADRGEDILFLPNQKLLNHFTGGLNNIVADLLWLRCIQYIGTESKGDRNFTWLNEMVNAVVQLDPHFGDAYRYGGMFLAALKSDDDSGIKLLERGVVANPRNFQLPYELAMIFLLNRKDEPGSKERATYYLSMAASIDTCPEFVRDLATTLQGQYNLDEVEIGMWNRMADSEDKLLRELAQRKLVEVDIRNTTETLNKAMLTFNGRVGHFPNNLEELAASGITPVPVNDALGGYFVLGDDGVIRNTTLLDGEKKNLLKSLQKLVERYKEDKGEWPPSLQALVDGGITDQLPEHPYHDETWHYDRATGLVS